LQYRSKYTKQNTLSILPSSHFSFSRFIPKSSRVEDIVSKTLPIRFGFVASPGLRSRLSSTKAGREVAPARPTLKAGAKETILRAEWYHRPGLGTAFKAAFVCDPAHFLAHARTHACTHVDPVVPLNWLFPRQGERGGNERKRKSRHSHRRREFVP